MCLYIYIYIQTFYGPQTVIYYPCVATQSCKKYGDTLGNRTWDKTLCKVSERDELRRPESSDPTQDPLQKGPLFLTSAWGLSAHLITALNTSSSSPVSVSKSSALIKSIS